MIFFEPDNVRSVVGGRWMQRPGRANSLMGVGIDTREPLDGRVFIAIRGESHDGHQFLPQAIASGSNMLIVEEVPKEPILAPNVGVVQVENTRKALGRLAHAYRRTLRGVKVIAVTGSAGKTTTKRLIHAVLSPVIQGSASPKSFNNEIGVPLTILAARPSDKYVVVEVGTNAPGEIASLAAIVEPDLAVITSLGRSHLEGLGSMEGVASEKMSMLAHLRADGLAIVNADAPLLRPHLKLARTRILFGESKDADLRLTSRGSAETSWFEVNGRQRFSIQLHGKHNALNALAAVAVGRRLGLSDAQIATGLGQAEPAPMRMEICSIGPITVLNDAYNANPESMAAALETFSELGGRFTRRVVVLGDMLELGAAGPGLHHELGQRLAAIDRKVRIDLAVFIGPAAAMASDALRSAWREERIVTLATLDQSGIARVTEMLQPGDGVLIKASRGMGLDRLIEPIRAIFGSSNEWNIGVSRATVAGAST